MRISDKDLWIMLARVCKLKKCALVNCENKSALKEIQKNKICSTRNGNTGAPGLTLSSAYGRHWIMFIHKNSTFSTNLSVDGDTNHELYEKLAAFSELHNLKPNNNRIW